MGTDGDSELDDMMGYCSLGSGSQSCEPAFALLAGRAIPRRASRNLCLGHSGFLARIPGVTGLHSTPQADPTGPHKAWQADLTGPHKSRQAGLTGPHKARQAGLTGPSRTLPDAPGRSRTLPGQKRQLLKNQWFYDIFGFPRVPPGRSRTLPDAPGRSRETPVRTP